MALSHRYRNALLACTLLTGLNTAACAKQHVEVAFLVPAEHALPDVGSMAVGTFSGDAGEDAADLLFYGLQRADHFAVFRQRPDVRCDQADNFVVAQDVASKTGAPFEADALVYGAVRQWPTQASYTTDVQHVSLGKGSEYAPSALETRVCRRQHQDLSIMLKVSLRHASREHICLERSQRYAPAEECVYVPGQISLSQAPFYFEPMAATHVHLPSLMTAIDALSVAFAPRHTTEKMVIYYDRRIPLSEQALAAASSGHWDVAAAFYEHSIEDAGNRHISLKARGRLHYNLAIALAGQGHFERALRHMEIAEVAETSEVYIEARLRITHYAQQAQIALHQRAQQRHLRQARASVESGAPA